MKVKSGGIYDMKKIWSILIVGILFLSGASVLGVDNEQVDKIHVFKISENCEVSSISVEYYSEEYVSLEIAGVSSYLKQPGKPVLPKITKKYELPFGAKNIEVNVIKGKQESCFINDMIRPASFVYTKGCDVTCDIVEQSFDVSAYNSFERYPSSHFSYSYGCGLNEKNDHVTHLVVEIYPVSYVPAEDKVYSFEEFNVQVDFDDPDNDAFPEIAEFDLVIIAPEKFSDELQDLVVHKNDFGVQTFLKTTEDIYDEFSGIDEPEQIKRFIKYALEEYGITYVLLVGGLNSIIWANPRENINYGVKDWYLPVRYNNFFDHPEHPLSSNIHDPGVMSDLYYADIYDGEGAFNDWDTNDDGIIAAWGMDGVDNDTGLDMYPDVSLGRLACRSEKEVRDVVNKIITYESTPADPSWFKKSIAISGDGFLDQADLDFQWDTNVVENGEYTLFAQSNNAEGDFGPVEVIHFTVDNTQPTSLTFNHDDNLRVDSYPGDPIAEIVSISEGDVLGSDDYTYSPADGLAYGNSFTNWADVEYTSGLLHIRGKTYDPRPYGVYTDIHVWIENSEGVVVFDDWRYDSEMYYEGEWVTGERLLGEGGGALYYMPEDFDSEIIWSSNGRLTGQQDVIDALSEGCGFAFFSGHGSPNIWADHYPGVPGNRASGSVTGLYVTTLRPWPPFFDIPVFPMEKIENNEKLPVTLIGGCHNSQFNVTMLTGMLDLKNKKNMWCHGQPVPECFSWYLVKMPNTGAIATIGNTGLGYGVMGVDCTVDGFDGGICIEFFKQYGTNGHHRLGDAYTQTLRSYVDTFDMDFLDHAKSLQQWVLLGDPSLMIGGYSQ